MATRKKVPSWKSSGKVLHSGYDTIAPLERPETWPLCITCGEPMLEEPNVIGATGFAEAMAGGSHKHHRYICNNAGTEWHDQVIALLKAISKSPSSLLDEIFQKEIALILKSRQVTKKHVSVLF